MSTLYLVEKMLKTSKSRHLFDNDDLEQAFIMGTTLNYLPPNGYSGGDYVQNCYNIGTSTPSVIMSRCFPNSDVYNKSIVWAAESLVSNPNLALDKKALDRNIPGSSTPPPHAYVEPIYPWNM
jgi:hypothetical protein